MRNVLRSFSDQRWQTCNRQWCLCLGIMTLVLCVARSKAYAVDGKRGWAGGVADMADATNSYWYYNWWHTKPSGADTANAEWIPLVKYPNNLQNKLDIVTSYDDVDTILVLNEPERADQSDVTVAEALAIWPEFEATGLNLITPAISDNAEGQAWLSSFMSQATANNYRMDGLAFHWYGASTPNNPAGAANNFLSRVDHYWTTYGLPVWITEFAMHDWGGNYTTQAMMDANEQFLDIVIPALENRSYVEAYSFYNWFDDSTLIEQENGLWTPTNVGDAYIPSYHTGETFDINGVSHGKDTIYLRGGTLTNTGAAIGSAVGTVYAIEGLNVLTGAGDWGVGGAGTVEINAGATLRKSGVSTARMMGATVNNRGVLQVSSGTFSLEGGADILGTGSVQLDAGGKISLGTGADRDGVALSQSLQLNGGNIQANTIIDGTHALNGTATVNNDSTFSGDGLLIVNGALVAPTGSGGGIIKDGTGSLVMTANNTYEGDTVIKQGTLRLTSNASISQTPLIEVQHGGTLDVSAHVAGYQLDGQTLALAGQINGSINASNGAQVTATESSAVISGNLTVAGSTVNVGGTGFNENPALPPIVSSGLTLSFDASSDVPGDAIWTNEVALANSLAFAGTATPVLVTDGSFPGIKAAYDAAATGSATGLNGFFEQQSPQISRRDGTFEVVFHVSDTAAGAEQVLFDVGAARGVSFMLSDDELSFNVDGDGATSMLTSTLAPGWHHAVGVIDVVGLDDNLANDSIELFVNNVSIGVLDGLLIDDWAGGNISGAGGNAAGTAGASNPSNYHGEIASVRFYSEVLFTPAEVAQNYSNLTGAGIGLPTTMHVDGDYTQLTDSTLALDVLSTDSHDLLDVDGMALLAGTLEVGEIAGFDPQFGDAFTLIVADGGISGQFDSVALPDAGAGKLLVVSYDSNEVVLRVAGSEADFDFDGDVDHDDLAIWQGAYGATTAGDADRDGDTDANDYLQWQRAFIGAGAVQAGAVAVPEPTAVQLSLMIVFVACKRLSHNRQR